MTPDEARKAVTDHLLSMGLDTSDVLEIEDLVDTAVRVAVVAALKAAKDG